MPDFLVLDEKQNVVARCNSVPSREDLDELSCKIDRSKPELIEIHDSKDQPTGIIVPRRLAHLNRMWHTSVHAHIYVVERGEIYVYLQRRDASKDVAPNFLDAAAAGHTIPRESLDAAVLRECHEEIGYYPNKFMHVGRRKLIDIPYNKGGLEFINREFQDIVIAEGPESITEFMLHPTEVSCLYKVKLKDFISMYRMRLDLDIEPRDRIDALMIERNKEKNVIETQISQKEFRPSEDDYLLKAALLICFKVDFPDLLYTDGEIFRKQLEYQNLPKDFVDYLSS